MQRRNLLKSVTIGLGGILAMPTWAEGWNPNIFTESLIFSLSDDILLGEIVGTIIPETNTPGAKSLGVHKLIQKLITDCQGKEAENRMIDGLKKLNEFSIKTQNVEFIKLDGLQRLDVLKAMEKSDDLKLKSLYTDLRKMTIDGYMKSEYVMMNILKYEWAPARYYGCVKV